MSTKRTPTAGEQATQFAVLHGTADKFARDLKELLDAGWNLAPGSNIAGASGSNGTAQFLAVLERPAKAKA